MLNAKYLSPVRQSDELIYWAVEVEAGSNINEFTDE